MQNRSCLICQHYEKPTGDVKTGYCIRFNFLVKSEDVNVGCEHCLLVPSVSNDIDNTLIEIINKYAIEADWINDDSSPARNKAEVVLNIIKRQEYHLNKESNNGTCNN